MLVDYHIHLEKGPYSLEWLEKFIAQGKSCGIQEFGISEHAYRFRQARQILQQPWAEARCTQNLDEYVALLEKAKAAGLPVKLGIEMDYVPGKEAEIAALAQAFPFDYIIGSVHWLGDWGFDLAEFMPRWEQAEVNAVYRQYFEVIQQAAASKLFNILGHLDLVKIYGYRPTTRLTDLYQQTIKVIAQSGCTVEISTAGLRKKVGEIYPHPEILALCREYAIPITLSSDAHEPHLVAENFPQALALASKFGYTQVNTFTARKPVSVKLS
ncbi:MAG TPA: histidinol-phosphatase HisJ family protein [Desulfobacteria bacterium]|nr:histidinol-phosphatase HisJ family protein [Desulfobacteria bacterium]